MESYNNKIRTVLIKNLENYLSKGYSVKESVSFYSIQVSELINSVDKYIQIYYEYLVIIMYLDAFKWYSYKLKDCMINDNNPFLEKLFGVKNSTDLFFEIEENPNFLSNLMETSYNFICLDELAKIILFKSLNEEENKNLCDNFFIHQQDLEKYDFEIDLNYIILIMQRKIKAKKNMSNVLFQEIIINMGGFIRNLIKNDRKNIINILVEIAKIDYMSSKFLLRVINNKVLKEHLLVYENADINTILEKLMDNQNFLFNALLMIVHVYVYGYYEGVEITLDIINKNNNDPVIRKLIV